MILETTLRAIATLAMLTAMPLALSSPALAHAKLVQANPSAGATVAPPVPTELRLSFSEPIELAFSKVTVTGEDGQSVGTGLLSLDPTDAKILVVPLTGGVGAGAMTVNWIAVADDGHKSNGSYSLNITN